MLADLIWDDEMREAPIFLGVCLMVIIVSTLAAEVCPPNMKKKRPGSAARRYQPKICAECQPHHRNLFLFNANIREEKLRHCSKSEIIEGHTQLQTILPESNFETLIIVLGKADWTPEPEVLDVMIENLGNVSLFVPNHSNNGGLLRHCRSLKPHCFHLDNLITVINQIETGNVPKNFEENSDKTVLDLYDARWISESEGTSPKIPNLHRQLDKLVNELCKRNPNRNFFVEILPGSSNQPVNKEAVDDLGLSSETSLSLKDILPLNPKSYDKNRAPKLAGQPTIVYFHVTVLSLDSINEESMTYVADIFLAQSWRDPRLRLPENMSEEYRILDVEWLRDIWRPDCFFKNAKKVTFHEMSIPNHYLWLYHDKTLLYMSKLTLVLSCAMKFETYPHDTQICSMMIESLSHTNHDLVFIWNITDPLVVNPEIELPQLDISKNYTADCTIEYSTGNFTCLAVVFNLRRRLGYHLLHTYIPSALIVVMSWISFWIKPEAIPARVTLGVTSLLTLGEIFSATQNTQSQQSLPPVSYVKAIDVWMSSCSVFVFLSLMEFAIVNNYMGPVATKAMKGYSEEDLRTAIDDYRDINLRGRSPVRSSVPQVPQYPTCYGKETAIYIDKFSRYFFPFSFFILNVVYWSTFL